MGRITYTFGALTLLTTVVFSDGIGNSKGLDSEITKATGPFEYVLRQQLKEIKAKEEAEEMRNYIECINLFNKPDYEKALKCFDELLKLEPENTKYLEMRRKALEKLGWFET